MELFYSLKKWHAYKTFLNITSTSWLRSNFNKVFKIKMKVIRTSED